MFNWFRRQIGNKQEQENQPETQETPSQESEQAETTSNDAATGESSQIDYLKWAKSAYKNIQERQGQGTTEVIEPVTDEKVEATEEIEAEKTAEIPTEEVVEATANITESVPQTAVIEETVETIVVPEIEIESEIEQDREEKTEIEPEIIAETASKPVEEPKPVAITSETVPEVTPLITEETPQISFDDEFIWSAQVLASQGKKVEEVSAEEINWLKKLRHGLDKTRRGVVNQLKSVVGKGPLNESAITQIESLLLQADLGIDATDHIIASLQRKIKEESLPSEQAIAYLKEILRNILDKPLASQASPNFAPSRDNLNIWLLTGVNGAGKTTTIGKLANLAKKSGYACTIAAADTFRAAAVQQVKVWGERTGTLVIANQGQNTDPAAVVYDAIAASQSRDTELLLVDTAGRLQNKKNLMEELAKIRRVIDKKAPNARVESLLVIDSSLGQNGLRQAQVFSEAAKLSGIVLTKLDGSAKGGIAVAIARQLNLPIRFIGVGEGIEDLRPFSSYEFVEALLSS
jgi:fused signal recognition particle receptor